MKGSKKLHELHEAAMHNDAASINTILRNDKNVHVDVADTFGNTPLHHCGCITVAEILIQHGTDTHIRNKRGDKPIDLMRRRGLSAELIQYMEQQMRIQGQTPGLHCYPRSRNRNVFTNIVDDLGTKNIAYIICLLLVLSSLFTYVVIMRYEIELKEVSFTDSSSLNTEL